MLVITRAAFYVLNFSSLTFRRGPWVESRVCIARARGDCPAGHL